MHNPLKPPYGFFSFGMFLLFLGTVYTLIGKAWDHGGGWVYRSKQPKRYWLEVAIYYFGGIGMIALFLYEIHAS